MRDWKKKSNIKFIYLKKWRRQATIVILLWIEKKKGHILSFRYSYDFTEMQL
jgi:hypothetical protein